MSEMIAWKLAANVLREPIWDFNYDPVYKLHININYKE